MESNLTTAHIFQMGWFNHQLAKVDRDDNDLDIPKPKPGRRITQPL